MYNHQIEQKMYISTITLLTVLCIQLAYCIKDVFCRPNKHEFYVKQIGRCKKCDRCPPGYGYADIDQVGVDMDPVHGAVSCLSCIPCLPGVTFSRFITFRPCRPCRNCTGQGRIESRTCTRRRNARCVDPPKQLAMLEKQTKLIKTQTDRTPPVKPEQDVFDKNKMTFLLTFGIIVIITIAVIVAFVQFRHRRKKKETRVHKEQASLASNDLEQAVSRETEVIALDTGTGTSSHVVRLLQTNSYSSFPSDFEYELDTLPVHHTSALDTDGGAEQTAADEPVVSGDEGVEVDIKHMAMSDRDIQEVSCHIAVNNLYKHIGRFLGVPDYEIQIIEEQNRNNLQETAFQTLKKWKELRGKKATKSELRKVLSNLKRNDLIEKVA